MNLFIFKYSKYIVISILIYLIIIIVNNLLNFYTILLFTIITFIFYYRNKRLYKKILYKIIFKNKNNLSFKNKIGAVRTTLEGIKDISQKINNNISSELINYEKKKIEKQLSFGDYNVILFGAGSSGKTSLARALLKSMIGKISPTIGTTKEITSYKIKIPILKRNINIIDTPGLFESSLKGEEREKSTIIEASKSDLILFVIDQDINKYELYLIKKLSEIGKKIIIVLNKGDLRSEKQNYILKNNILQLTSEISKSISVVITISSPKILPKSSTGRKNIKPEVSYLFKEIIETLDKEGEELLADNILFQCNKLGILSKTLISTQRDSLAKRIINKYSWITVGVTILNPISVIDFLTTTSVNVKMIMEISKIYGIKITNKEASDLSKSLLTSIAKLGLIKGGIKIITSTLSTNFSTVFIAKSIQSITAGWLIRLVGLSIINYFKNDQNWGDGGIQDAVQEIYKLNKREEILNDFINEAINKINLKKENKLFGKLPPYFQKD